LPANQWLINSRIDIDQKFATGQIFVIFTGASRPLEQLIETDVDLARAARQKALAATNLAINNYP
jgi:hypothetical protein